MLDVVEARVSGLCAGEDSARKEEGRSPVDIDVDMARTGAPVVPEQLRDATKENKSQEREGRVSVKSRRTGID